MQTYFPRKACISVHQAFLEGTQGLTRRLSCWASEPSCQQEAACAHGRGAGGRARPQLTPLSTPFSGGQRGWPPSDGIGHLFGGLWDAHKVGRVPGAHGSGSPILQIGSVPLPPWATEDGLLRMGVCTWAPGSCSPPPVRSAPGQPQWAWWAVGTLAMHGAHT